MSNAGTKWNIFLDDWSIFLKRNLPGVNFINVLGAAFMHADPKSAKKTV